MADGLDDARNAGAQVHGGGSDDDADLARNWHDDDGGPTKAAGPV